MRATVVIKRKRLELQGRSRARLILNSGGVSGKSQESKQWAATKRGINAVMERSVRGAVASVTGGVGDEAEVFTDPVEVAREYCEWNDRRMSLMCKSHATEVVPASGRGRWACGVGG